MIASIELHNAYNDLYKEMRKYIWSIEVVKMLADLEVATYKAFPDIDEILRYYHSLYREVRYILPRDEDTENFYKAFGKFEDIMNDADQIYNDIYTVSEVLINENNEESTEEDDEGKWLGAEPEEPDTEETGDTEEVDTF